MEITILEKAQEMLNKKLNQEQFLRVTVTKGGCAGLTYDAEIAQDMHEDESVISQTGTIRIVSNTDSMQYIDGLTIDYSDDLISGGLRFKNANAGNTCSCGSSFSLAGFPIVEDGKCSQ